MHAAVASDTMMTKPRPHGVYNAVVRQGLFERALGAGWRELPDVVKRGHELERGLHGEGAFDVTLGASWIARLVARVMGMPRAGRELATRLDVTPDGDELVWRRNFGGTSFDSRMYAIDGGRIAERRGLVELCLRVTAEGGAVVYRCEGARVRLGALAVPMPSFFAPRVEGRVWADGDAMRTRIHIAALLIGTIVTYEGPLRFGAVSARPPPHLLKEREDRRARDERADARVLEQRELVAERHQERAARDEREDDVEDPERR